MTIRQFLAAALITLLNPQACSADPPDIRIFVSGSFRGIRAYYAGHPMIVHIWGLSCGPCLLELPEWGKLLHERPDLNLVFIHADPLSRGMNSLMERLKRSGLSGAENWAFAAGESEERLRFEIDPKWQGEMPMTLLIAPTGATKRIIGSADMASIKAWLDAEGPSGKAKNTSSNSGADGVSSTNGVDRNVYRSF